MRCSASRRDSSTDEYRLGWRINEDRLPPRLTHRRDAGVTSVLSLFPNERLVIVVLTNTRNAAIVRLARELAALRTFTIL